MLVVKEVIPIEATKTLSNVKSRKQSRKITRRIILSLMFIVSVVMLVQVAQQVLYTMNLQSSLAETQAKFIEVEAQNQALTSQQAKLEDADYVKVYARGSLLLSKQDEQIFVLPSGD